MLAPPDRGFRRQPRLRGQWPSQFTVVPVEIEARAERGQHELADPIAKGALVGRLRRTAASDRLEVLGRTPCHVDTSDVGAASSNAPSL